MSTNGAGIDPKAIATEIPIRRCSSREHRHKGRRYLIEGRLSIRYIDTERIVGSVAASKRFTSWGTSAAAGIAHALLTVAAVPRGLAIGHPASR